MKIKKIRIEGIQSIKYPLEFNFNESITQLKGHNAAGKSVVVKSLKVFSGCYSRKDFKSLITRDLGQGRSSSVRLTLEDDTVLYADIKPTGNVEYYYIDKDNNVINKWNAYSRDIAEILNLKFIEQAELCLNFKPFNDNIFIDTKPNENAEIMDYLCKEPEVEIKIANIEEYSEHLRELKTDITREMSRVDSVIDKIQVLPYKQIQERDGVLTVIYQTLKFIELLNQNINLIEYNIKNNEYSKTIDKLNNLSMLKTLNLVIDLKKQRYQLYKLYKSIISYYTCLKVTEIIESKIKLNEIILLKNKFKYVNLLSEINNNIKSRSVLKELEQSNKLTSILAQITKINNYSKLNKKIKELSKIKEQNISLTAQIIALNNQKRLKSIVREISSNREIKNKIKEIGNLDYLIIKQIIIDKNKNLISINKLNNQIDRLNMKKDINNKFLEYDNEIKNINTKKEELNKLKYLAKDIKVCPVCKQPLNLEHTH